ncbi:glycoside hydrolase family 113 [Aquimarina algicola]|uniref:Glycoside hydrolase n=1 Tax=Aquimarina algicola TaxID=2589995 RepID=A0A504J9F7_9FLAO|nr:glycoside hydrolase [Aquimarina algicola]TPN87254.1 glycoside hydrolase [Aquimarina algicola]
MKRVLLLLICFIFCACSGQNHKINGVSFVGAPQKISLKEITPVAAVNANWAAVMPFGFLKKLETPEIVFNVERQWWGERRDGAKKTIQLLNEKGIKVMLKPQIWVWHGEFTGNIKMNSEEDWKVFENSYQEFIMLYAELAEEMKVPLLCIGTELHTFVQQRTGFWNQLIAKIKTVYSGELTYAENWDQFNKVHFWKDLDYIGIDAYFPVAQSQTPKVEEIRKGWQTSKNNIKMLQSKINKPVLFTEYGYRSVDYTGKTPWESSRIQGKVNLKAQENALKALYQEFWDEPWFAGGFLWKWYHNHQESGGTDNNRFTVQNKPSEKLVRAFYNTKK